MFPYEKGEMQSSRGALLGPMFYQLNEFDKSRHPMIWSGIGLYFPFAQPSLTIELN